MEKLKRRGGFSVMDKDKLRELSSAAGKKAHAKGRAHRFTKEEASAAGKLGGAASALRRRAKTG